MATATAVKTDLDVIAASTSAKAERKAIFAQFSVARSCYGSIENYLSIIEPQLKGSAFEIIYSDSGYAITRRIKPE